MSNHIEIKNVNAVQPLKAGTRWHNQKVQFITHLFGKNYYWMTDTDGTTYLAKVGRDGLPDLS